MDLRDRALRRLPARLRAIYANANLEDIVCALLVSMESRGGNQGPTETRVVAKIPCGTSLTREIRVSVCAFPDRANYVDLRLYHRQTDGQWMHGKGLGIHGAELAAVGAALVRAGEMLSDMNATDPGRSPENHNGET